MPNVTIELSGMEAVKYLADKYSWNVYVPDYSWVNVIAYPQVIHPDGTVSTDTSQSGEKIFKLALSEQYDLPVGIALRCPKWYDYGWREHDDWLDPAEVMKMYECSVSFSEWFDANIVNYVERRA